MSLVRDEYQTNPGFFDSLTAVREGNLYACVSFNNYSTNVGYALADAYYAGSVIYPERFDDVNIARKGRRYPGIPAGTPLLQRHEGQRPHLWSD